MHNLSRKDSFVTQDLREENSGELLAYLGWWDDPFSYMFLDLSNFVFCFRV